MSISLEGSIRTCKVDQGWASRVESDRFLNPVNMVCPTWNGMDSAGRRVQADSFYTKAPGCQSALDRVNVENFLRPTYAEYVTLDTDGIAGAINSPSCYASFSGQQDARIARQAFDNQMAIAPPGGAQGWGQGYYSTTYPKCYANAMEKAMARQQGFAGRNAQAMNVAARSMAQKMNAGCGNY